MKILSRQFNTIPQIVQEILRSWAKEDLDYLRTNDRDQFGLAAREIRNQFKLWDSKHPLTAAWHSFPNDRDIRDGIDFSSNHPDEVSSMILKEVRRALHQ